MSRASNSGVSTAARRNGAPLKQQRGQKRKRGDVGIEELEAKVSQLEAKSSYSAFADLPLSSQTQSGLKHASFSTLTDIQSKAIPLALQGQDILGAAKTGSGKTLAFLIPVLENLYRAQHVGQDAGLGAMVISPTRELAIQIFEVLRKVGGRGHQFAAGLIIGGKSLQDEKNALERMNIVVCTPGRIKQHLEQTAGFDVDNLKMLVLDEADRIMDMGFKDTMDAIVEYLPKQRQTLLFSATQSKRVSDLSRLALRDPAYISVHESADSATPKTLQQNYVITPLSDKLDTLWSFLQTVKKSKTLVFFSSAKEVRFVFESFRHMQPGVPLSHLHGRQKQTARLDTVTRFSQMKYACLFSTDVAARGLDFPAVDWVVQVDCPEDADTYIHRVGRTARYERDGRAVLFLDPSEEEGMLQRLEQKRVPIERINVRAKKQQSIQTQLQNMCFQDKELKYLGQKAFISYVKSIYVQKDRQVFNIKSYDLEAFAASLGLPGAPRIKFLKGDEEETKRRKNAPRQRLSESEDEEGASDDDTLGRKGTSKKKDGVRTKYDRMFERRNQDVLSEHYGKIVKDDADDADRNEFDGEQASDEDLFDVKQRIPAGEGSFDLDGEPLDLGAGRVKTVMIPGAKEELVLDSKRREKLLKSKKKLLKLKDSGRKLVYDDEGNPHELYELEDEDDFRARGAADEQRRRFLAEEAERVKVADAADKRLAKEKRREKKEKRKARERAGADVEDDDDVVPDDEEDGLANFIADAQGSDEDAEVEDGPKKKKKWFENDKHMLKERAAEREIETFDDLEAEAARLLA